MKSFINLMAALAVIITALFFVGQGSQSMTNTWLEKVGLQETSTTKEDVKK